jgi:hypothetical protein
MTRILDLDRDQLVVLRGRALTQAVADAEGRTIVAEVIAGAPGLVDGVHGAELVAAMGADIVILNFVEEVLDQDGWRLPALGRLTGLDHAAQWIGRPIGVNLEPGEVPPPRRATVAAARRLVEQGAAMLCITANPGTDTGYDDLVRVTAELRAALGQDVALWAGKMHQAGRTEAISTGAVTRLATAGADGVLLPLPGTVPGVTRELAAEACLAAHQAGAIVMGTVGTSQEGAHATVVPHLALLAKEVGVDAHHIGDAGLARMPDPELLYAYSVAVRGRRHTWRRMVMGNRPAKAP